MNDLYKEFAKEMLLALCDELGINISSEAITRKMVVAAMDDMKADGVPADDDISDVLLHYVDIALVEDAEI